MLILPIHATDADILVAVRIFIELLADENYAKAHELFTPAPERQLTPDIMRALIEGYGFAAPVKDNDEPPLRVTHWLQMTEPEPKECFQVEWFEAHPKRAASILGMVHYDLPLNHEWSDLTAIFDIIKADGGIALSLDDIHVL